jgi:hypothetical protein
MRPTARVLVALLLLLGGGAAGGLAVYWWDHRPAPTETKPPRRCEATVFLPTTPNPEHPFTPAEWDEAVGLFAREFGGATLGPAVEGCWLNTAGKLQRESVRLVTVSFEPGQLDHFRHTLTEVGRRLGQEAVYVRYEEPRIDLLTVGPASRK